MVNPQCPEPRAIVIIIISIIIVDRRRFIEVIGVR